LLGGSSRVTDLPLVLPEAGCTGLGGDVVIETPSILITDDDVDFRETLQDVLAPQGYRTLLAGDGEEALRIVERQPVHLLLIDMHMPKLTGLETFRLVREMRAMLPCILLSAAADEHLVREARSMRIFRVLSKPVSRRRITLTVQLALAKTYNVRPADLPRDAEP
jgi:CheY-like chemotaxis protein